MELGLIWLGTIGFCVVVERFSVKYRKKEIEIRGYEYSDKPKNIYKIVLEYIKLYSIFLIPGVNLIFTGTYLFNLEKLENAVIEDEIKSGDLVKKKEKEEPPLIEAVEIDNDLIESSKVIVYKVENNEKKQMTREEKIEFLKQEYSRLTGKELTSLEKGKGRQKRR